MTDPTPSLRELFESALALAPHERPAWLLASCPDAGDRATLERMCSPTIR